MIAVRKSLGSAQCQMMTEVVLIVLWVVVMATSELLAEKGVVNPTQSYVSVMYAASVSISVSAF